MNRRIQINGYRLAIGTLAVVSAILMLVVIRGSSGSDVVATELDRMAKDGKNFDPTRLHALGPEGLARTLAFLSHRYSQCFVWPTRSYADGFDVYVSGMNHPSASCCLLSTCKLI